MLTALVPASYAGPHANQVVLEGVVEREPKDYPATARQPRFARFDLCQRSKDGTPFYFPCAAHGEIADKLAGWAIRRGDTLRVSGFLACRYAKARCGWSHRFIVIVVQGCEILAERFTGLETDRPSRPAEGADWLPGFDEEGRPMGRGF